MTARCFLMHNKKVPAQAERRKSLDGVRERKPAIPDLWRAHVKTTKNRVRVTYVSYHQNHYIYSMTFHV